VRKDVAEKNARPSRADRPFGFDEFAFGMAMTSATIQRLGRKIAASTIARSSAGKAAMRSVKRISTAPIAPPKKPAVTPIKAPMATATPLATIPMTRDVRAP